MDGRRQAHPGQMQPVLPLGGKRHRLGLAPRPEHDLPPGAGGDHRQRRAPGARAQYADPPDIHGGE